MFPAWYCPQHGALLEKFAHELRCPTGHAFAVIDGIPRFVSDDGYAEAFALQWNVYRRTQLDSFTGVPLSRDRARRCMGEQLWSDLSNMNVLEVGCGAGRFTEVLLDQGAKVTSTDLTAAVATNAYNFPASECHRIAQADVRALPFVSRSFDVVFCLGVVQHTPNPEQTIATLYDYVKPGGWLVLDHYSRWAAWYLSTAPLFRAVLRRLPPEHGLRVTEQLVRSLWPAHVHLRAWRRALSRISPVVTYFHVFPGLSEEQQQAWSFLDTHDGLTDRYKWFRNERQIRRAIAAVGAESIITRVAGNGVEASARRPTAPP